MNKAVNREICTYGLWQFKALDIHYLWFTTPFSLLFQCSSEKCRKIKWTVQSSLLSSNTYRKIILTDTGGVRRPLIYIFIYIWFFSIDKALPRCISSILNHGLINLCISSTWPKNHAIFWNYTELENQNPSSNSVNLNYKLIEPKPKYEPKELAPTNWRSKKKYELQTKTSKTNSANCKSDNSTTTHSNWRPV